MSEIKGKKEYLIQLLGERSKVEKDKLLGNRVYSTDTTVALYQQKLNRIMNPNPPLEIDGQKGDKTVAVLYEFQKKYGLPVNGLFDSDTVRAINMYDPFSSLKVDAKCSLSSNDNELLDFFCSWNKNIQPILEAPLFIIGQGIVVYIEKFKGVAIHINWDKIIQDLLFPACSKKGKWIHVNKNSVYRKNFRAYRFGKIEQRIIKLKDFVNNKFLPVIGVAGLLFETIEFSGKVSKGEVKFLDGAKLSVNYVSTFIELMLLKMQVNLEGIAIKEAVVKAGKAFQPKFAVKIVGSGLLTGGLVIAFQCAGAFMLGVEFGKWIEEKTHIGETAVNYYWDLFFGEMFEQFCEWKANRIVCIKYPKEWSEEQIQEFKSGLKLRY